MAREAFRVGLILKILAILAAGLFIYAPGFSGQWVWDDYVEIVDNALLTHPQGVLLAWQGEGVTDYLPVKTTLQWVFTQAFGKSSAAWHVLNFVLHLANAFMVWLLFARLKMRYAWLGGLLFVAHPVLVMSVGWISEFKNTLSMAFLLPAMIFFVSFVDRKRGREYGLAVVFFLLAVLSKSSVVMFPVVMLLYFWWRNSRITLADVAWTVPFFGVSLVAGLVTISFQHHHAMSGYSSMLDWPSRVFVAGVAPWFYLGKILFPVGLLPTYPRWSVEQSAFVRLLPWLLILAALLVFWLKRKTWGRTGLLGLGFFGINLLPVLGLIPMAFSRFSFVSDHFLYVPILGILGLLVVGAGKIWDQFPSRRVQFGTVGGILLAGMLVTSRGYARLFGDEMLLWSYTLRNNPDAWQAHLRLGYFLIIQGDFDEAVPHQNESIRLLASHPEAEALRGPLAAVYNNYAIILEAQNRDKDVVAAFREAMRLDPRDPDYPRLLGEYYTRRGKLTEAAEIFAEQARLHPRSAALQLAYGEALWRQDRRAEAAAQFQAVLVLDPSNALARERLGVGGEK